jgi:hypothetical protein
MFWLRTQRQLRPSVLITKSCVCCLGPPEQAASLLLLYGWPALNGSAISWWPALVPTGGLTQNHGTQPAVLPRHTE